MTFAASERISQPPREIPAGDLLHRPDDVAAVPAPGADRLVEMRIVECDRLVVRKQRFRGIANELELPVADDVDIVVVAKAAFDQSLLVLGPVDECEVEARMLAIVAALPVARAVLQVDHPRGKARQLAKYRAGRLSGDDDRIARDRARV